MPAEPPAGEPWMPILESPEPPVARPGTPRETPTIKPPEALHFNELEFVAAVQCAEESIDHPRPSRVELGQLSTIFVDYSKILWQRSKEKAGECHRPPSPHDTALLDLDTAKRAMPLEPLDTKVCERVKIIVAKLASDVRPIPPSHWDRLEAPLKCKIVGHTSPEVESIYNRLCDLEVEPDGVVALLHVVWFADETNTANPI
ncbi:hypothetical protein HK105_204900 [Polyrhizophydium stewartii]|uniref:Uncharacterized protein n=1 Tax=Polyrhizophydium stewartii TaxID=2732419 RepID=A0ABR4N7P7_9FUNG